MKRNKEDVQLVINSLIELIEIKQSALDEAKNYGKDNHAGYQEISKAVREISDAAKSLAIYAETIANADFSETKVY